MQDRRAFLASTAAALAAGAIPGRLSAADAAGDVAIVRDALLSIHPGLYRYNTPEVMAERLTRFGAEFEAATGLEQRFLALSRFLATIRCGHSFVNPSNQKRAVSAALFDRPTRLPFTFRWVGGEMVVTQLQSSALPFMPGTIITAINGVRPRDMLAQFMAYARADGSNDAKRRALLSVTNADPLEAWDIFQSLLHPPVDGKFRLDILEQGKSRQLTMQPVTLAVRKAFGNKPLEGGVEWFWEVNDKGVAILTMDNWAMFNSKWDWQAWLNDRLDSLGGAKGLVIDLRRNEGGNDCGDMILARLAGKDIQRPRVRRLVRYQKTPAALNPYLDTWDDSFRDWGDEVMPHCDRYLQFKPTTDATTIAAKGPRINVPLAVLTSANNSSATFQFAELVRAAKLGKLVGETTGGNRRGINGGAFFFVRLPASGLEFDLPLIGHFPEAKQPDAGIVPDIRVSETAKDIAMGRDRAKEAAVASLV